MSTRAKAYGMFLGERYKAAPNIIWMFGNDYQIDHGRPTTPSSWRSRRGSEPPIPSSSRRSSSTTNMSTSYDNPTWPALIDVATAYTYYPDL